MAKSEKPARVEGSRKGRRGDGRVAKRGDAGRRRLAERGQATGQLAPVGDHAAGPLWVPDGVSLQLVPDEVRQAIVEVVQPVYQRLVLGADDPLEKSLGVTVAHLLWLEVLQQFDLKQEYAQYVLVPALQVDHGSAIDQHLRIIDSKVKVGYLLARLRELRRQWRERSGETVFLPEPQPEGGDYGKTGSC